MEAALKKLLGSHVKTISISPAFSAEDDLHIAHVVYTKSAKVTPPKEGSNGIESFAVRGRGEEPTAVVYFNKSKLPAAAAAQPAS